MDAAGVQTGDRAQGRPGDDVASARARLDAALDTGLIGCFEWDVAGGVLTGDERFARFYDVAPEQAARGLALDAVFTRIHPDDLAHVRESVRKAVEDGADYTKTFRLTHHDGTLHWLTIRGRCVERQGGAPARYAGVSIDVTAQRLAERRARILSEASEALLDGDEPAQVLQPLLRTAGAELGFERICMFDIAPDGEHLRLGFSVGVPEQQRAELAFVEFSDPVCGIVAATGAPLVLDHVMGSSEPRHAAARALGLTAFAGFAVKVHGQVVNVISFASTVTQAFSPETLDFFATLIRYVTAVREREMVGSALRASERRYRSLFDNIDAGFCVLALRFGPGGQASDYMFVEVNPAFEVQTGLADVVGRWMRDIHPDHEQHWYDIYGRVARTGQPVRFEREAAQLGRWYEVYAYRIDDPALMHVACLFNDITGRKRAEAQAQQLNLVLAERVEARTGERDRLWTSTSDLMATATAAGMLQAVNPAWTAQLGWGPGELRGQALPQITHPDDRARSVEVVDRLARGETVRGFVGRLRTRDGEWRTITWTATPDPGAGLFHIVGRDETDRLRAEEALRQSQKMEAVGQLTGGLAHDFNNLLTAVTGGLDLLKMRIAKGQIDQIGRYVDIAQTGARRAAALTQRLLAFSRRQTLAPTAVDADQLVAGMADIIDRTLGPAIEIRVVGTAGLWPVLADGPQLENALLNLCINARDAMPHGGRLTIETCNKTLDARAAAEQDLSPGEYVSLSVSDTGIGMAPETIARIFDPFFTTKPLGEGTGLGLSMVYGFTRQSGGQVRVYSEPGSGTTMSLYLPRLVGDAALLAGGAAPAEPQSAEAGETVLVVEDEFSIRTLVGEVLEEAGYRVLAAATGPAGVMLLQGGERIDLLITDVGLPGGLNGRQVADAGRMVRPGLKVLFVTGYAANAAVGAGHLDGGMEVLTKPFNVAELERRVHEMVRSARGG